MSRAVIVFHILQLIVESFGKMCFSHQQAICVIHVCPFKASEHSNARHIKIGADASKSPVVLLLGSWSVFEVQRAGHNGYILARS